MGEGRENVRNCGQLFDCQKAWRAKIGVVLARVATLEKHVHDALRHTVVKEDTYQGMSEQIRNAILVAEDSHDDLLLLKRALQKARVLNPVLSVHDGEETIAYLQGEGPYSAREKYPFPILLLLDLNMPKKSGFDVLAWLQGRPMKDLGVVVLTGFSDLK